MLQEQHKVILNGPNMAAASNKYHTPRSLSLSFLAGALFTSLAVLLIWWVIDAEAFAP